MLAKLALVASLLVLTGCKNRAASDEPPQSGAELYRTACRRCHGDDGSGGPPVKGTSPRNLRDPKFQESHTDAQIVETIRNGTATGMPPFRAVFTQADLAALVAHVRGLKSE